MLNPLDVIHMHFRLLPPLEMGHWVVGLADALSVHPGHKGENAFPADTVLTPDQLRQIGNEFIAVTNAAESGDRNKKAERDAMRPTTELLTAITIQWMVMRSVKEKNPSLLANLGLQFKKKSGKKGTPAVVTIPGNVKVKHGQHPGTINLSAGKVVAAALYEVTMCQGDPTREESWVEAGKSRHCRSILLEGLTPGEMYHFRVRCYGTGGYSPWSPVVSLRAL